MPPRTLPKATAKQPVARRWSSTESVRMEFLDAARVVFAKRGFTDASVTEVVERAGASVGSLYHHFGSKSDLFLALWQRHHDEQLQIARAGVAQARQAGVTDPFDLFAPAPGGLEPARPGAHLPGRRHPARVRRTATARRSGLDRRQLQGARRRT